VRLEAEEMAEPVDEVLAEVFTLAVPQIGSLEVS